MKKEDMKHYTKVDYSGHTYKLHDTVYVLNHYDIEEKMIVDIFDDYYSDDSDYICKCVYTTSPYRTDKSFDHLEDVYLDRKLAEYRVQSKKDSYDRYVTRGY